MSLSEKKSINYQGLTLTAGIVSSIAAGVTLANVPQAKAENPRVSVAVTNIISNKNSVNFAAEIVGPSSVNYFNGATVGITYQSAANDASQILITGGTATVNFAAYSATTVEAATARAIDNALGLTRYGDIIGMVNAYNGPPKDFENPSASIAITNILSNTNSQNLAAEIVAPPSNFWFSNVTASVTYSSGAQLAVGVGDPSQYVIANANAGVGSSIFTAETVEASTARAIDAATTATRFGDVIGIVNAYDGPYTFDNPRASIALTNILSNTNSQNFAAEVVGPETVQYFTSITASVTYLSTPGAITDYSQFAINLATVTAAGVNYTAQTVEAATGRSISAAQGLTRFGDVIGIVRSWQNGGSAALD